MMTSSGDSARDVLWVTYGTVSAWRSLPGIAAVSSSPTIFEAARIGSAAKCAYRAIVAGCVPEMFAHTDPRGDTGFQARSGGGHEQPGS
jgi:hypothetical protein